MPKDNVEVAIVGAGAAGVAAGRRLREAQIDCLLIEARPRLGGRAYTLVDQSGFALDLGCGWLHSADRNPWTQVAEREGFTIDKTPPPWSKPSLTVSFPLADQQSYRETFHAFYERLDPISRREPDVAAASALEPGSRWNALINAVGTYISGAELDRVSARDFENYHDTNVNWRVFEGYGTAIAAYGAPVPNSLGNPVRRIDHSGKRLRVETENGVIGADQVIVTLPSAVIAGDERLFAPALPEKTESAGDLPLGLADKLFISLERAEEFEPESHLIGNPSRTATAIYQFRPFGRPQIEAYFGGGLARELEAGGERAFFNFAVSELTALFGSGFAKRLSLHHMHCWGSDPFARGSYSYALPGKADCRARLAAPVEDRLFFAGEACSTHDFSTAHGGYLTGVAAAEQVIAARKARGKK
jgi:monoamine oxidase